MANQSSQTAAAFRTGQRVHATGDPRRTGTIRYIGPISGHDGEWIGVDWDADSGGKHDGMVNGTRYFSARTSSSGSFVRPKGLCTGISLLDAIYRRYRGEATKEEEGTSVDQQFFYSISRGLIYTCVLSQKSITAGSALAVCSSYVLIVQLEIPQGKLHTKD